MLGRVDRSDELADARDRTAEARDAAADASDRRQDALDRQGDERDCVDLAALFEAATGDLDRAAIDEALGKVNRQDQVSGEALRQGRRFVSLLTAMDNIRDLRDGLERARGQRGSAVVVQRCEEDLRLARRAYLQLVED
jgi:hypothetical protein